MKKAAGIADVMKIINDPSVRLGAPPGQLSPTPEQLRGAVREGALGAGVLGTVPGAFGGGMLGAGAGSVLGTLLGAARGNTPEGLGRGAIRGGATGAGAGIGSSLGAGLGAAISGGPGGAAMGGLLGGGLGGAAGFFGSGAVMGPPESEREEKPKKRTPVYGESVPDDGPWYDRGKGQREQQLREWYDKQHGAKEEKQASICSFIGALTAKKEAADSGGFLGAATKSLAGAGKGLLGGLANPGGAAMSGAQSLMSGKAQPAPAPKPAPVDRYGMNTIQSGRRPPTPAPAGPPQQPYALSQGSPVPKAMTMPGGQFGPMQVPKLPPASAASANQQINVPPAPAPRPVIGGYSPQPGSNGRSYMQKIR